MIAHLPWTSPGDTPQEQVEVEAVAVDFLLLQTDIVPGSAMKEATKIRRYVSPERDSRPRRGYHPAEGPAAFDDSLREATIGGRRSGEVVPPGEPARCAVRQRHYGVPPWHFARTSERERRRRR